MCNLEFNYIKDGIIILIILVSFIGFIIFLKLEDKRLDKLNQEYEEYLKKYFHEYRKNKRILKR